MSRILITPSLSDGEVIDSRYFHFFLSAMPEMLPYQVLFPQVITEIFCVAVEDVCVRRSVLSVSSLLIDHRLSRPFDKFQLLYINSLQLIQSAIEQMNITPSLAVAVFLITWIDVVRGKFETSRTHLNGLYRIFQYLGLVSMMPNDVVHAGLTLSMSTSPLLLQIWRLAIRLDWTASFYLIESPVFPSVPAADELHRAWVREGEDAEWSLAAFALDSLTHKACYFAAQVRTVRQEQHNIAGLETKIRSVVKLLENELLQWRMRPIIRIAEMIDDAANSALAQHPEEELPPVQTFLNYPPIRIINPTYTHLLNHFRALQIYITLISHPQIGPQFHPRRLPLAIDICRCLAALGENKARPGLSKVWIMCIAGVALGGERCSPAEGAWLLRQMEELAERSPLMVNVAQAHAMLWNGQGDFWNELSRSWVQTKVP
jgi:hypothetical protein